MKSKTVYRFLFSIILLISSIPASHILCETIDLEIDTYFPIKDRRVKFKGGTSVYRYENGIVSAGTLAEVTSFEIQGKEVLLRTDPDARYTDTYFYESGNVKQGWLAKKTTLLFKGDQWKPRGEITVISPSDVTFDENGELTHYDFDWSYKGGEKDSL